MAILNQKRILNLIPKVSAPVTIHVSQGDVGTEIEFTLVKGDELFVNTGNLTASVHGVREDGANFGPFTCTLSGSSVIFPLHSEMTAVKGSALAEIVLVDNGGSKVGSANFGIMVEESVFPLGVTYDNDVSVYESILAYVQTIPAQLEDDISEVVSAFNTALTNEISARQTADSNEANTRTNAVSNLQAQIDQIIAPSGEAPSAAEVENARVGADNVTYDTLGDAIRNQVTDLRNALKDNNANLCAVNVCGSEVHSETFKSVDVTKNGNKITLNKTSTGGGRAKVSGAFAIASSEQSGWLTGNLGLVNGKRYIMSVSILGGSMTAGTLNIVTRTSNATNNKYIAIQGSDNYPLNTVLQTDEFIATSDNQAYLLVYYGNGCTFTNFVIQIDYICVDDFEKIAGIPEIISDIEDSHKKINSLNFFEINNIVNGYVNANGEINSNENWKMIYKLKTNGAKKILLTGKWYPLTQGGLNNIWCYDANGASLGGCFNAESQEPISQVVTLLTGTEYISVCNSVSFVELGAMACFVSLIDYIPKTISETISQNIEDVIMIPIFGQSLSIGESATPVISTTPKFNGEVMFNGGVIAENRDVSYFTSFVPLAEINKETPASGCAEKIIEMIQSDEGLSIHSDFWENHRILFVSCGHGARSITQLMDDYYEGLQNAIQGAQNICDAEGTTLNVPCWIWIQGETDQKDIEQEATSKTVYKEKLTLLQTQLNTYVKGVTSQENDIKCIVYQCAAQNRTSVIKYPTYTNTDVMGVPTAQMELVRDNESFVASSPVYVLDHNPQSPMHLTNLGSKMLGIYCGMAAKSIIFGEKSPTGLTPVNFSVSENILTLTYDVPVPPLRIDTEWVKEVEHYGFVLLDSNNNDLITNVSVFDDSVVITCSASPLNAMLFYGFNGIENKDGRLEGSRGNLCDSAKYMMNCKIAEKRYTLGNYAYSFVRLIDDNSGTI